MTRPNKLETETIIRQKHWRKTNLKQKPFYNSTIINYKDYMVCDFCKKNTPTLQIAKKGKYYAWWICKICYSNNIIKRINGDD